MNTYSREFNQHIIRQENKGPQNLNEIPDATYKKPHKYIMTQEQTEKNLAETISDREQELSHKHPLRSKPADL